MTVIEQANQIWAREERKGKVVFAGAPFGNKNAAGRKANALSEIANKTDEIDDHRNARDAHLHAAHESRLAGGFHNHNTDAGLHTKAAYEHSNAISRLLKDGKS